MESTLRTASNAREERAKKILAKASPETIDANTYLVPSQYDDEKKYRVTHLDSYSCECPDFTERCVGTGLYCKHIKAIILFQKVKASYEVQDTLKRDVERIVGVPDREECPECHSAAIIKRGTRKTTTETKQRYACKDCRARFVLTPVKNIKGNARYVCLAMDCYYKGLSYRDIADQFQQFYGLTLHHETIRRWILRFGEAIETYTRDFHPERRETWNADETMIRTKKGKNDYEYVWNVMDNETKFLLASVNSGKTRDKKDARRVMIEAKRQNGGHPAEIITDKLPSYGYGIRSAFKNWGEVKKVKHVSILGRRRLVNNNAIESHHTHQKEFHKVRRGVNEVQAYQDGFKVYHNYVRKGVKDKRTPAERCGISVEGNRWKTLLVNALINTVPSKKL